MGAAASEKAAVHKSTAQVGTMDDLNKKHGLHNETQAGHIFDLEFPKEFRYGHASAPPLTYPKTRVDIVAWADRHYNRPKLICTQCELEAVSYPSALLVVIGQEALSGVARQDVYIFAGPYIERTRPWRMIVAGMGQITGPGATAVDVLFRHADSSFSVVDLKSKVLCTLKAPRATKYIEHLSSLSGV